MNAETENQPQQQSVSHRGIKKIVWIIILLIICGAMGFVAQQYWVMRSQIRQIQDQYVQLNQVTSEQAQLISDQQASVSNLEKVAGNNQVKWKLTEAEYLVRMANLTLHFQHNVSSAIILLKAADHRLKGFSHPAWLSVRKVLAEDIERLEALPQVDITGLYLKMQALDQQMDQLPLIVDAGKIQPIKKQLNSDHNSDHSAWVLALIDSWQSVRQVLIIRHHDQPIRPFLLLNQQKLLVIHLHVLLANAEWALLQGNQTIYSANLKQAQQTVQQYFIHTSAMTTHMVNALNELQQQKITATLPDMSNALRAIKALENTEDQL